MHQLVPFFLILYISFLIIVGAVPQVPYNYHQYDPYRRFNQFGGLGGDQSFRATTSTIQHQPTTNHKRISRADAENAKFLGAANLEPDIESTKTFGHLKRKYLRNRLRQYTTSKRCFPYGRDAADRGRIPQTHSDSFDAAASSNLPRVQQRSFWDINVYNVYPTGSRLSDCWGSYDPIGYPGGHQFGYPAYQTSSPLTNFLRIFAPGILQNALAVTARPLLMDSYGSGGLDGEVQNSPDNLTDDSGVDPSVDPAVDPNYRPLYAPQRRPNSLYFDSEGAPPLTPAQLVGGVSTTVNGIIQQLTGNLRPVYQNNYRRSKSFG